ncbi:hypothetical protein V6N13_053461 [Hibiscus sabdariffa]
MRYVGYGENVNLTLSSSTESPKEPEKIEETPTSGTKRRKGKNHVEASPTEGGVDFESKTRCNADGTIETFSVPKLWRFDQEEIRQALTKMVVIDELPFSFVEREGFRAFARLLFMTLFLLHVLPLQEIVMLFLLKEGRR